MNKETFPFLGPLGRWAAQYRRALFPLVLLAGGFLLLLPARPPAGESPPRPRQQAAAALCEQQLEQRLTALLQCVQGAGRTRVMVMLETAPFYQYATDTRDSLGGTEQTHILLDGGSALTETIQSPVIGGVAVLCDGGDDPAVAGRIYEIVSSLLGLSAGRISVTKMN